MQLQVEDSAKSSLLDIYYYHLQYSLKNAIEINSSIRLYIHCIENSPYIGRQIPEMSNKNFREIIYIRSRNLQYRIMYYISEKRKTIYIFNIINSKQNFYKILKLHNYFNRYL